ncbi:hypothetical protein [Brevibacillus choshinensis]|uniref:Uncharacterized protein n=1 Tax=Brevibacillus choshinensis TaxID=54911 RepID=A0ABX7FN31_BRECH|nr:hypothetical protein [Brevibacillus choshinensis]QRG66697.1 hypothetical protein JNE38_24825 [Brevibacillus choshinensis]
MKKTVLLLLVLFIFGTVGYLYVTDDSADTPLLAIEQMRSEVGPVYQEIDMGDGKLIFFVRGNEPNQMIHAEYAKRTWKGWKWGYGGGHSLPDGKNPYIEHHWSSQYFYSTKDTPFDSPFPMLFGAIDDSAIQSIHIESGLTRDKFQAHVIENPKFPFRVWYLLIPVEQGVNFTLSARTNENKIVHVKEERNEPLSP